MKSIVKEKIVVPIFSLFTTSSLAKITGTNLIIPYYHVISDDCLSYVQNLYQYKNIKQFNDDIDWLMNHYSPISLHDVIDSLQRGRSLPKHAFLLTFDDGFREMNDIVAPVLLRKGVPATFFINTAFIDNKELCYQHKASILVEHLSKNVSLDVECCIKKILLKRKIDYRDSVTSILSVNYHQKDILDEIALAAKVDFNNYLLRHAPYLTTDQIKELIHRGFTIGAHSIDHPLYAMLSLEDQIYQTIESIKMIRERFSLNYGAFAFPHSDNNISNDFFNKIYGSGLIDVSFGTGGMISDGFPRNFQRISLEKPRIPAEKIIALQYARKLFKILSGKNKVIRK